MLLLTFYYKEKAQASSGKARTTSAPAPCLFVLENDIHVYFFSPKYKRDDRDGSQTEGSRQKFTEKYWNKQTLTQGSNHSLAER